MSVTLHFQSSGTIPGDGAPVAMRGPGLTIGRGQENDLVLPDPERMLSKRHCVIEERAGDVVVLDLSTNGTFLNYGRVPLGPTPTPLNDGDVLSMGPYELRVDIASVQDARALIADPLADGPVSHGDAMAAPSAADLLDAPGDAGDFLDDLLGGPEPPAGHRGVERPELGEDGLLPPLGEDDLLAPAPDPHEGQGASMAAHSPATADAFQAPATGGGVGAIPEDWDDLLAPAAPEPAAPPPAAIPEDEDPFAEPEPPRAPPAAAPSPAPAPAPPAPASEPPAPASEPPPAPRPEADAPAAPPAPPPAAAGDPGAAHAFLRGVGIAPESVPADELAPTMERLGGVLRTMIQGLREILMTRTSIKSEFRIEQTSIRPGGNNPLKFSVSPEQAVEAMVRPTTRGYLAAEQAAEEALRDVKAHEVAMVTGMEAALKGVLARLDPEALEGRIQTKGGLGGLLKSRKARYWEVYETMYAELREEAEEDFHALFAREFARAYKDQLDRLK